MRVGQLGIAHPSVRFHPRGGRREKPGRAEFTVRPGRRTRKGSEAWEGTHSLASKGGKGGQ